MTIAIAIPAFDSANTKLHLGQLLHSIELQKTSQEVKVYIGFHTHSWASFNAIKSFVLGYNLNVQIFPNHKKVGFWQSNLNAVLDIVPSDEFIKILFQDDILLRQDSLSQFFDAPLGSNWIASGCSHFNKLNNFITPKMVSELFVDTKLFDPVIPFYDNRMPVELINFIGAPSVIALPPSCRLRFDNKFIFTGDVEFYYQLFLKYGPPIVIPKNLIGIRKHSGSLTSRLQTGLNVRMPDGRKARNIRDVHAREVILMKRKYGFPKSNSEKRTFLYFVFLQNLISKMRIALRTFLS